jgi:hypothetical protein
VVDDELDHDLEIAGVGFVEELLEVGDGAVGGVDADVVRDVVAVVAEGGGEEGEEPEAGDAEFLEIALEVADAVGVGVREGADVDLVDDGVFEPERVGGAAGLLHERWGLRVVGILGVGCADWVEGRSGAEIDLDVYTKFIDSIYKILYSKI